MRQSVRYVNSRTVFIFQIFNTNVIDFVYVQCWRTKDYYSKLAGGKGIVAGNLN